MVRGLAHVDPAAREPAPLACQISSRKRVLQAQPKSYCLRAMRVWKTAATLSVACPNEMRTRYLCCVPAQRSSVVLTALRGHRSHTYCSMSCATPIYGPRAIVRRSAPAIDLCVLDWQPVFQRQFSASR